MAVRSTPAPPVPEQALVAIARDVLDDLDALSDRVLDLIWEQVAWYRASGVDRQEVRRSARSAVWIVLEGLSTGEFPPGGEIRIPVHIVRRRAMQGLPLHALMQTFHIGFGELWRTLLAGTQDASPEAPSELLMRAGEIWGWFHEVTDAVGEAYHDAVRARETHAAGVRQHLLESLVLGDFPGDEIASPLSDLGFDPDGGFVAIAVESVDGLGPLDAVQRTLNLTRGQHLSGVREGAILVLSQSGSIDDVVDAIRTVMPDARMGIGLERPGLIGARLSVGDAERALNLLEPPAKVSRFEGDWIFATVNRARQRLAPMFEPGERVALDSPHLADAVEAYAACGFSISDAARRLHLHHNTVAYRLDRWRELTGWDPRTFQGLASSLMCLRVQLRRPAMPASG